MQRVFSFIVFDPLDLVKVIEFLLLQCALVLLQVDLLLVFNGLVLLEHLLSFCS